HGRIVKVLAAQLVKADDERDLKSAGAGEGLEHLRRVGGKSVLAGQVFRVRVAGQETLGEADHLHAVPLGGVQRFDDLGQVAFKVAALRLELEMSDAHGGPPTVSKEVMAYVCV